MDSGTVTQAIIAVLGVVAAALPLWGAARREREALRGRASDGCQCVRVHHGG